MKFADIDNINILTVSELFGEAVSRTCASDRDKVIFQLAYGASLLLFKLGDECELWNDDLFKRVVEKLEKIKRMTSETYDEIARVTNAAWEDKVEAREGDNDGEA